MANAGPNTNGSQVRTRDLLFIINFLCHSFNDKSF